MKKLGSGEPLTAEEKAALDKLVEAAGKSSSAISKQISSTLRKEQS